MFQETCLISGLPISNNQQVVLMFLAEQRPNGFHCTDFQTATHYYCPVPIIIKGTYRASKYGFGLYDITTDDIVQHAVIDGFRNFIKDHEHPTNGTKFTRGTDIDINNILSMAYHGVLSVSSCEKSKHYREFAHGFILREVYDLIMDESQNEVNKMFEDFYSANFEYIFGSVYYHGKNFFQNTFNDNAMVVTPKIYLGVLPFVEKEYSKEADDFVVVNNNYVYSQNAVRDVCEAYEAVGKLTYYLEQIRRIWTIPERLYSTRKIDSHAIHNHLAMLNRLTEKYAPLDPDMEY